MSHRLRPELGNSCSLIRAFAVGQTGILNMVKCDSLIMDGQDDPVFFLFLFFFTIYIFGLKVIFCIRSL